MVDKSEIDNRKSHIMNLRGNYTPLRPSLNVLSPHLQLIRVNQEIILHFLMDNGELIIDNWLKRVVRFRSFF